MPVRSLTSMGSSGRSTTYGVSLDKGDLSLDGVLDRLEDDEEVNVSICRREPGRYELVIVGIEPEAEPPAAD